MWVIEFNNDALRRNETTPNFIEHCPVMGRVYTKDAARAQTFMTKKEAQETCAMLADQHGWGSGATFTVIDAREVRARKTPSPPLTPPGPRVQPPFRGALADHGDHDVTQMPQPYSVQDTSAGLELLFEGYGTANVTGGAPVFIEKYNGRLRLHVWADITQEDPTHVIDLEGAREPADPPAATCMTPAQLQAIYPIDGPLYETLTDVERADDAGRLGDTLFLFLARELCAEELSRDVRVQRIHTAIRDLQAVATRLPQLLWKAVHYVLHL